MPRGLTGVYTLPQPAFVAGTTILSSSVNSDLSDVATALTQSLATTGVSSMTGPIKAFSGTEAAPGFAWASDVDTGFYLSSAGVTSYTSNGADVFDMSSLGISLLVGEFIDKTGQIVRPLPIGCAMDWPPNAAAPDGWVLGFGQTLLIADFPDLATVYGTTYGGDGITTFGVIDYRGRVGIGRDNMGGVTAGRITFAACTINGTTIGDVGTTGNTQTYTFLQANLPSLNWTVTDPGHFHVYAERSGGGSNGSGAAIDTNPAFKNTQSAVTGISVASGGSSTPFSRVQPGIIVNKIVYHGVFA